MPLRLLPIVLAAGAVIAGAVIVGASPPVISPAAAARAVVPPSVNWGASVHGATACNPLGGSSCMVPFPSDYYTVVDHQMPSGRKVLFPEAAMPANHVGIHISPSAYSRNDGFSPGASLLVHVAGLSLAQSGIPGVGDVGTSLKSRAGVVLLDETTGRRLAYWGELDARDSNPATKLLMIHPATNLPEGHRIAVALTNVKTAAGRVIGPGRAFAAVRGSRSPPAGTTDAFLLHERSLVGYLGARGVPLSHLNVAWDFTVASTKNLTGYAIEMRDVAMSELGTGAPAFAVTQVTNFTRTQNPNVVRQVTGTFAVPSFLNVPGGGFGSVLNIGKDGLPQQIPGNQQEAAFRLSRTKVDRHLDDHCGNRRTRTSRPLRGGAVQRGHKDRQRERLGHGEPLQHGPVRDQLGGPDRQRGAGRCRSAGRSLELHHPPDQLTQSLINALYLGRLMGSPTGFDTSAAFRVGDGIPFIDTSAPLTYYGNSEGSLAGGALTAISTSFRRAVLGVPSMDYDILLDRSADFVAFNDVFEAAYGGADNRQVILDLLQMLWDRGETDGYAEQMTGGLPGTPSHQVLLQMGFGDHQVSNFTTITEARTIGAAIHRPALAPGRFPGNLFFGLPAIKGDPYRGRAALYVWDPEYQRLPPPT